MKLPSIVPVLPSRNIKADVQWHAKFTGFIPSFGDDMYAGMVRGDVEFHLQWHADTEEDPLNGGSVIKIFVDEIEPLVNEFIKRGTISLNKFRKDTAWGTHEFGFYDLNGNAIFIVQDI